MENDNNQIKRYVSVSLEQGVSNDYFISFSMNNQKYHSEYIRTIILEFYNTYKQIIDELYEKNKNLSKEINEDTRVYTEFGSLKNVRFGVYLEPDAYSILNKICIGFNRHTYDMVNIIIKSIINKNTELIDNYYAENKHLLHV